MCKKFLTSMTLHVSCEFGEEETHLSSLCIHDPAVASRRNHHPTRKGTEPLWRKNQSVILGNQAALQWKARHRHESRFKKPKPPNWASFTESDRAASR